jgi:hypothetical protein
MAGGGATLQLLATLQRWPGALQLATLLQRWPATHCSLQRSSSVAFFQRCCSNALDVATLLRWPIARWTLQHVAAMSDSALGLGALLRCPTTLQLRPTLHCNVFFFFFNPTT